MGSKEKASEKIRELNFDSLARSLDKAIKRHDGSRHENFFYVGHWGDPHDLEYWNELINSYTEKLPKDERILPERLNQLLEGKVEPLLANNCVQCARLAKHLSERYGLK